MRGARAAAVFPVAALGGCAGEQSAFMAAGPAAESINFLGLVMTIGGIIVLLLVTGLLLAALIRRPEQPLAGATRRRQVMLWTGALLPTVVLTALLPLVFVTGTSMRAATPPEALSISVTGHQYWWQVDYARQGLTTVTTANELRIPVGEPVEIRLASADVIHSFWVPSLAGKTDMIPGRTNRMVIQADRPGVYRGQCAEFCGQQHSLMAFHVTAVERPAFESWLAAAAAPARSPETPEERQGRDLFVSLGCGGCHTVAGVSQSSLGPDLSRVASRRTIGAGALPNGVGNLAAWIAGVQHIKPGARMPTYDQLRGPELRALAAYLASLQ